VHLKLSAPSAGQKTDQLALTLGLKLLTDVLGGMGAAVGLPSLALGYKQARSVQFRFTNVVSVSVMPFGLGKYLASGALDLANPFVNAFFANEDTQEFIIFDVLKSNAIAVTAKSDQGTEINVDIPAIQAVVGADISVKSGSTSEAEIVYEGKDQLTFRFKAFEVLFEKRRMDGARHSRRGAGVTAANTSFIGRGWDSFP
jgi:hypothetical protein